MPAQTMPATMPARAGARRRGLVLLVAVVCLLAGAGRASGVSTGAGADATALGREDAQMDAAATQSRHDARAFEGTRSDAAGAGAAQRVHRFCATAAPRCAGAAPAAGSKAKTVSAAVMARKVKPAAAAAPAPAQARAAPAAMKDKPAAAAPASPRASTAVDKARGGGGGSAEAAQASGRWGAPLTRLKDRLAELENKLHQTVSESKAYRDGAAKQVISRMGRRLLASDDEEPRAFPDSFYRSFGGLSQLAGVSTSVLRDVEGQICGIYTAMCSSLASLDGVQPPVSLDTERSLWSRYRASRHQKLKPRAYTGVWHRRRVAYPRQWRGLVTAAQASGATNLPRYSLAPQPPGPFTRSASAHRQAAVAPPLRLSRTTLGAVGSRPTVMAAWATVMGIGMPATMAGLLR